jgi:hypothetical protein
MREPASQRASKCNHDDIKREQYAITCHQFATTQTVSQGLTSATPPKLSGGETLWTICERGWPSLGSLGTRVQISGMNPVMDLARAPRRTARKKGSGSENALGNKDRRFNRF